MCGRTEVEYIFFEVTKLSLDELELKALMLINRYNIMITSAANIIEKKENDNLFRPPIIPRNNDYERR